MLPLLIGWLGFVAVAPTHAYNPVDQRQHKVALNLGVGSAVGAAGITYAYAPHPQLQLEAGVGAGLTGLQLSAMARGSWHIFTTGVGLSFSHGEDGHGKNHDVRWINVDAVGLEGRWDSGFSLSICAGVAIPLDRFHYDLGGDLGGNVDPGAIFPQGRIALGWWF